MLTCVCCRYTEPGSSLSQAPEGDLESYFKGSSTYFSPGLQYSGVQTGETRAVHSGISEGSNGLISLCSSRSGPTAIGTKLGHLKANKDWKIQRRFE